MASEFRVQGAQTRRAARNIGGNSPDSAGFVTGDDPPRRQSHNSVLCL